METSTLLGPYRSDYWTNSPLEPQYITSSRPVSGRIHISSMDAQGTDKTDCKVFSSNSFVVGARRLRIVAARLFNNIPNVNPYNNVLTLHSGASGLDHDIILTEGFYDDPDVLAQRIQDDLNAATAATLITFSHVPIPHNPGKYVFIADGVKTFYWKDSPATQDITVFDFAVNSVLQNTQIIGPMNLVYTTHIDFVSYNLQKWRKLVTTSSNEELYPVAFRLHLDELKWGLVAYEFHEYNGFSWNASEPFSFIDIKLLDSKSRPLYHPQKDKLVWEISLIAEL